MLHFFDNRRKRAPTEASSLQALLAHHKIDTNVLKTQAQFRPATPKLTPTILTPQQQRFYHRGQVESGPISGIRSHNQRPLPDSFYTNSDIFPQFHRPPGSPNDSSSQVQATEKQDFGEPEAKTTSFRDTAIIALKLSQSIMNLYKTVSPYIHGE